MKKRHEEQSNINEFKGISPAVIEESVELATIIASNERAMELLKEDNEQLRRRLQELFESFQIPWLKISIPINTTGSKEKYTVKMVNTRGYIPPESGLKKLLSVRIKGLFPDWEVDKRKRIARKLAEWCSSFLRKDAILVTETRKYDWGKKIETDKITNPYLYLTKDHHNKE
jgi:hypothetical protein